MIKNIKHIRIILLSLLFLIGLFFLASAFWIYAKAQVAQFLIDNAWQEQLKTGKIKHPWVWADTWPVAFMKNSRLDKELYILSGASGSSLAFGPGHIDGTATFEMSGTKVISAHRDTHFDFLQYVELGDIFSIQNKNNKWQQYKVVDRVIKDIRQGQWIIDKEAEELHLITCYPFHSITSGGNLRYIVIAERVNLS